MDETTALWARVAEFMDTASLVSTSQTSWDRQISVLWRLTQARREGHARYLEEVRVHLERLFDRPVVLLFAD